MKINWRGPFTAAAGLAASVLPAVFAVAIAAGPDEELIARAKTVFGPLPGSMPSPDNPITPEKVRLGNLLFFEPRISIDRTVSCARCHPPALYAADGLRKAVGNRCRENPRNSPTILNAAAQISAHWIGNRTSVEDQARQSVTGPPAFGMPDDQAVAKVLKSMPEYVSLFRAAFPGDADPVTVENFAKAVGAFERTLVTPAPFDDFQQGKAGELSDRQKRGLRAFLETGCMTCHFSPYLGGQMYQKFGVFAPYQKYTKSSQVDEGRFAVTRNEADKQVFKVPVLRNVAMTPPYFHDGSVDRLVDAVAIMARVQLGRDLQPGTAEDITAFLQSLTGRLPESIIRTPVLPAED